MAGLDKIGPSRSTASRLFLYHLGYAAHAPFAENGNNIIVGKGIDLLLLAEQIAVDTGGHDV